MLKQHTIKKSPFFSEFECKWEGKYWGKIDSLAIDSIRIESSLPFPKVEAKLCYNESTISVIFKVDDHFILCKQKSFLAPVHTDSCVEFFVQPVKEKGYFNFEYNCCGVLNASFIQDWERTEDGFKKRVKLTKEDRDMIKVRTSIVEFIEVEIDAQQTWYIEYTVPIKLLEKYLGHLESPFDKPWNANFFKCADNSSHPHWISWSPIPVKNFHLPECFGNLEFEKES